MNEGYIRMLYPDSPRHPRQKYLLTVKGLALYNSICQMPQGQVTDMLMLMVGHKGV